MASDRDSDARRSGERERPLIESVSLETAIAGARAWLTEDQRFTATMKALNAGIVDLRNDLVQAWVRVPEKAGAPVDSPSAAIAAAEAARRGLAQAFEARAGARAAVAKAQREAAATLQQGGDVKVARWAIGTVAVILMGVLLTVLLHG